MLWEKARSLRGLGTMMPTFNGSAAGGVRATATTSNSTRRSR